MRFAPIVAVTVAAAAATSVLANDAVYNRRDIHDLVARAVADGKGSEAFSLESIEGGKGLGLGLFVNNNNNQPSRRDVEEFIARAFRPESYHNAEHDSHPGGQPNHGYMHEHDHSRTGRSASVKPKPVKDMTPPPPYTESPPQYKPHHHSHEGDTEIGSNQRHIVNDGDSSTQSLRKAYLRVARREILDLLARQADGQREELSFSQYD